MPVPGNVVCMAAAFTVAITVLVVGCVVDDSWWSLVTAVCYLAALCFWLLFRPGCMPCMTTPLSSAMANQTGCCGGNLCQQWDGFLTGFFGFSCILHGLPAKLSHAMHPCTASQPSWPPGSWPGQWKWGGCPARACPPQARARKGQSQGTYWGLTARARASADQNFTKFGHPSAILP